VVLTLVMAVAAFVFSAVAGYMAGLVGSSSNPVSGVAIATIMLSSLLLVAMTGGDGAGGPAAALLVGAVVCCAAAMGGDNLQDLKTGHLVGATPWRQQIMQIVGVVTAALVIVPVLSLLEAKYGIGEATVDHPHPLTAPQATLMATLAKGVFGGALPWGLVGLGAAIGVAIIALDLLQRRRNSLFRLPVLAVALGIYLPLKLSAAIMIGGVLAEFARRRAGPAARSSQGVLLAAGLITGEAMMGIVLAVPVALGSVWPGMPADPFGLFAHPPWGPWPGLVVMTGIALLLVRKGSSDRG
jgi:putative OPT family oligopeptide transporter